MYLLNILIASGDDDLLQQALALSLSQQDDKANKMPDLSSMTEDEQLHYALQMSLNAPATTSTSAGSEKTSADAEMKEVNLII